MGKNPKFLERYRGFEFCKDWNTKLLTLSWSQKCEKRRRGKHDCSLPLASIYSEEAAKQLDDHLDDACCYCIINVSGSLLLHANDNTSSCLVNQRGHASKIFKLSEKFKFFEKFR